MYFCFKCSSIIVSGLFLDLCVVFFVGGFCDVFLVSVSNRENLGLCLRYGVAGFPGSVNGFWAFVDVGVGDYVSFLYGARVFNLYRVVGKAAYRDAERLPPWPPLRFGSGQVYYFPFRLFLEQVRVLEEPMVRPEFAYVAENLLLRGGYRKTHFQADAVTFYNVSLMGSPFGAGWSGWRLGARFTRLALFFAGGWRGRLRASCLERFCCSRLLGGF